MKEVGKLVIEIENGNMDKIEKMVGKKWEWSEFTCIVRTETHA